MHEFESTGLWWLPGHETERIAGTLKVSRSGNLHLSLVGALGSVSPANISKFHSVVLGSVDKSPSGNDVTLAGCMLTESTFGSFAGPRTKYHASRAFFGAHLPDQATSAFKQAVVRIGGLTEWAHVLSGIALEQPFRQPVGKTVPLATYTGHSSVKGDVPGGNVSLYVGLGSTHRSHELIFREKGSLSIGCETPKSADELNRDYIYPLQNLMTFVCDRAQEVESFSVRPESTNTHSAENPDIQVIGPRVQPEDEGEGEDKEPLGRFQMLFTLEDVEFADFVGRWMRLTDRYSDACSIFFGLKYGPAAYLDMTFMSIVQVLHLYYSRRQDGLARHAEEEKRLKEIVAALSSADAEWVIDHVGPRPHPTLEGVLRQLVDQHSGVLNPLVSNRQDRFVNEVMNTLYYMIHRDAEVGLAASHGADLYWMMEKLRFLIKACFLSELGFSEQKIFALFDRNGFYQHMRQLEAARESRSAVSPGAAG